MTAEVSAEGLYARPGRIVSIDAVRILALFAVIVIHTKPFLNPARDYGLWGYAGVALDQATRFGVPFFFTVAGYFFAEKLKRESAVGAFGRYGGRLYAAFLFWSLLYLCLPNITAIVTQGYFDAVRGKLQSTSFHQLLWDGTAPQLWFLTALIPAAGIVALFYRLRMGRYLLRIAGLAYLVGLVFGPYSIAFLGEDTGMRRGVPFGILYLAIGFQASVTGKGFDLRAGLLLIAAGYGLQFLEAFSLWHWFGSYPLELDNLLGTPLIAAGVFRLAMARQDIPWAEPIARAGRYALGIYASHWLFVKLLVPLDRYAASILWELLYPILVLILALALSWAMAQARLLRRFVC